MVKLWWLMLFKDRQNVQICPHHQIADVAVDKDVARGQAQDFIGGDPAVGTPNVQVFGCLATAQFGKEVGVFAFLFANPRFVVVHQDFDVGFRFDVGG